ncbi:MAG: PAS domain-containing protein [Xanthobacteraceae bacterium]|nr:MAG: PAS domain-containing protein [Xanthobacteraceae bacterium]
MKHPASQAFFRYWDAARGLADAPSRRDFDPGPVRGLLGDSFVLACDGRRGHPIRMAGTRVCALFGRDLKGEGFASLWDGAGRGRIEELITIVANESQPLVAGVTACPEGAQSGRLALELLLLPLQGESAGMASVAGLLAPLTAIDPTEKLRRLGLTGWRYLNRQPAPRPGRQARHWRVAHGITLFQADGGSAGHPK